MHVKLISYSQAPPGETLGFDTPPDVQDLIAYCARVSNPTNQMNSETSEKLLNYLMKYKHWSPFEMVSVCMEIDTTRDIARQILRHRSFSFQEFSQRYAQPSEFGYPFELREARLQDPKNRQNSIPLNVDDLGKGGEGSEATKDEMLYQQWLLKQKNLLAAVQNSYDWAITNGIAKEQARALLPEGLTKSRMYVNGTVRSWIHYIELRAGNGTQLEHMLIAKECARVISYVFPLARDLENV